MNPELLQIYGIIGGASYLVGSVPMALIVTALFKRVDLRSTGSGSLGIYNTFFRAGKLPGVTALLWNLAAATCVILLARVLAPGDAVAELIAVTAVVAGSMWQLFARFRGSRGTTTLGFALLVGNPPLWAACFGVWLLALLPRRRTTDATPALHLMLPAIFGLMAWSWSYAVAGAVLGVLLEAKRRSSPDDALALGLYRRFGINTNS